MKHKMVAIGTIPLPLMTLSVTSTKEQVNPDERNKINIKLEITKIKLILFCLIAVYTNLINQ